MFPEILEIKCLVFGAFHSEMDINTLSLKTQNKRKELGRKHKSVLERTYLQTGERWRRMHYGRQGCIKEDGEECSMEAGRIY